MGVAQPLNNRNQLVNPDGTATEYFIRWAQQFSGQAASSTDVATLQSRQITAGFGLSGGGDLSANRTLSLGNPALTDPNANRGLFWNDTAGKFDWLTFGSGLSLSGTTLSATGGGGGLLFDSCGLGTASTTLFAGKGVIIQPAFALTIHKVRQIINVASATNTYQAHVVTLNSSNVIQSILASSAVVSAPGTGVQGMAFDLTTPATIPAKTRAAILVYLTNATATTSSGAYTGVGNMSNISDELASTYARHAAVAPTIGATVEIGTTQFNLGVVYTLAL